MQASELQITWTPGTDTAVFNFDTHAEARAFAEQFLHATQAFQSNNHYDLKLRDDIMRVLPNGEIVPGNFIGGWVYIRKMDDFFVLQKTNLELMVTQLGGDNRIDMTSIIKSVMQYGASIAANQFVFEAGWEYARTQKENHQLRFQQVLAIIKQSRQNPNIIFYFGDPSDLPCILGPEKAATVQQTIDEVSNTIRLRF